MYIKNYVNTNRTQPTQMEMEGADEDTKTIFRIYAVPIWRSAF